MIRLFASLYSWTSGAFIMIGIFSFVIFSLVAYVFIMMNNDKKKKERD
ncbi:hypothetical protein [Flavobacterium cerinum]|uniref:DUF3149 domain-containing protein n=1 Tax=Flavobacterium cerinum TaxID=2502784 RepID=A0ABY5IQ73_9FLAO|nr:hypothetical protein [Flavobacterium cerinum]UUC44983.1 hypothetical protein NOX80_15300 [Flavobacterium cerinum]